MEQLFASLMEQAPVFGVLLAWIYLERAAHRDDIKFYREWLSSCVNDTKAEIADTKKDLVEHIVADKK